MAQQHAKHYWKVWVVLLAALGASLALGALGVTPVVAAIIFVLAAAKALVVVGSYMHLHSEARFIKVLMASLVLLLVVLFVGLFPDVATP